MIDNNLYLTLELCALTALVGIGIWRVYRTRISGESDPSTPVALTCAATGNG
jgi:hypothetical protein